MLLLNGADPTECCLVVSTVDLLIDRDRPPAPGTVVSTFERPLLCGFQRSRETLFPTRIGVHVSFMRTCDWRILRLLLHLSHISAKCAYRIFFPHKLAFSTAILILFVSILPVSIRFRYLNHLVANGMAPSMCPEYSGPLWSVERGGVVGFEQFCTIFPHISAAYLVFMRSAYFFKCRIKLTCPTQKHYTVMKSK